MRTLEETYKPVTANTSLERQFGKARAGAAARGGDYAPLHYLAEGFMGEGEGAPSSSVMSSQRTLQQAWYDAGRALDIASMVPGLGTGKTVLAAGALARPAKAATRLKVADDVPGMVRSRPTDFDPSKAYPPPGEPVLKTDPKTGKQFLSKGASDEATKVAIVRKQAQTQIESGDWSPFFDVTQRYYADPSKYNLPYTTVTQALPKKQQTIEKYIAQADTPAARERLKRGYEVGSRDPGARDGYAMGQLEDAFIKELGPEAGRAAFKERFADAMAATTGGADPTANLLMSAYANFQRTRGQALPPTYMLPYPIGGRYAGGNLAMYEKIIGQGQGLGLETPKRYNFSANFLGQRGAATIDEQMMGGFDPTGKLVAPPGESYGVYEGVLHRLAQDVGVPPANFQDVTWAGLKRMKEEEAALKAGREYTPEPAKPMMQHLNEAIWRTHKVTGLPQEDVLKGYIRGDIPLYGIGAGTLFGGAYLGGTPEGD